MSLLRRKSRNFRSAFREFQKSGFYHGPDDGTHLVNGSESGDFAIFEGDEDHCLLIDISNGKGKATTSIGIKFDLETETFHLDDSCLDPREKIPLFQSICDLVNYYQDNEIELEQDFAEDIWRLDYEEESDVYADMVICGPTDDPEAIEFHLEGLVEESKNEYCTIILGDPIL